MKILVISFEFPPDPGGMGEYTYQTAKRLSEYHSVMALVAYKNVDEQTFQTFQKKQPFKIKRLKGYNGRTAFVISKIFFFIKLFKENHFDLVIVATANAGIISWFYKKYFSVPYIMIAHGSEFLPVNPVRDYLIKTYYNVLFIM